MENGYRPTEKLRWRKEEAIVGRYVEQKHTLQQLWVSDFMGYEPQWRDVETLEESVEEE